MNFEHLHFANSAWLWGMIAIPLIWLMFLLFYRPYHPLKKLESFIDSHLLPYLLVGSQKGKRSYVKALFLWSFVWACLTLALAGPRWNFREIEVLSKDQSLVIVLDLSESMNANDIKPSRLIRAKQKIEDLLNKSPGVKMGLVAFAADPHMIAPITDDKETIRHLLPSLDTDLVYIQGSKLSSALEMASTMLETQPGVNKAVLVISDGEFEDGSALAAAKKIADKEVLIYTMGIGTAEGTVLQDKQGNTIKKNGVPILSKLVKNKLKEISKIGKGKYLEGRYGEEEGVILIELSNRANAMEAGKTNRLWDEGFYFLILPALPIFLFWFRRGTLFLIPFLLFLPNMNLQANLQDLNKAYFMNSEELGREAFNDGNFETAADAFKDSYRKGVAYYKAGDFASAEKMFRQSSRPEVAADAGYNLGNALVQQKKLKKAITAYEDVLKKWPDHTKAKENLELVKKMLEEQQKQKNQQDQQNQEDQKEKENQDQENKQDGQDRKRQDKQDSEDQDSEDNKEQQDGQDQEDGEDQEHQQQDSSKDQEKANANSDESNDDPQNDQEPPSEQNEDQSGDDQQDSLQQSELGEEQPDKQEEGKALRAQEDQEADAWLNLLSNDPKDFLKKKFYIESKKNGTKEGIDPW